MESKQLSPDVPIDEKPTNVRWVMFALACVVAFATGSSWSTMAILLPNVVGLAYAMGPETALGALGMVVVSIGAVLDGSIFGDHCSPISDTTVLSSVSSGSDHIDHVNCWIAELWTEEDGVFGVNSMNLPSRITLALHRASRRSHSPAAFVAVDGSLRWKDSSRSG